MRPAGWAYDCDSEVNFDAPARKDLDRKKAKINILI